MSDYSEKYSSLKITLDEDLIELILSAINIYKTRENTDSIEEAELWQSLNEELNEKQKEIGFQIMHEVNELPF